MMSIAQVRSAGSAGNYYTDKDNYYVLGSMGERWAGQGAEQLGLQGSVDKDVFTRLLEGRLPDGADLSRMQDGRNRHRPGYDLTFSAPKSVSMMAMLGGDKRLIEAHNQAVDFAVRQVEALASTRVMTDGQSETVLTGNLVMALFNHDTSRDQEPQLHTHAVVANVTQHNGEWKTLSSDKVGKTGFIENVYANQIAFGRLYREKLKEQVEALGYETEVVGKHGMWEMPGVPVEAFSGRSQTIREAVGEDASLKSRDVAALDTRKSKQHVDPEVRMAEWMQTLKETGFDIRAYRDAADQRAETRTQAPGAVSQEGPDVQQAVTQAIAGLSERKVQFTYTDVLARTVGILPPENGVIERARAGIDEAISREQLIPLDREKGLFTSGIHVLDELSVRALSRDIMKQNRVTIHPEKSVPRTAGYSDAVSVLAQDRPSLAIVSGQGGAAGQRERVAELVMMAREQGREVQIIAADRRSQMNLKQDERLSGELITGRRQLLEGMAFTPGSTVIVDQGEKLSLKETLTLLDGAARHNVQVLITDSGQRTGTGSALMAMKDAGVNTYRWQGGEQRPATIISEPDRNVRYARLAGDFAASVKAGEESVAQVSGVREQAILTQAIRSELKTQGVLGHQEVTMTALSPVWLDSRSRYLRDMYRPGMVMEQWNPETRSHDRYVIDRVLMVLDHANRILHLDQSWMFLVGRGAFPLFALVWGLNLSRHTHIRQEAINRLWGWAVIAQFAYYLAGFPWYEGNILFAFAVAAQVLTWCETRTWWRSAETMLLLAMWLPFSGTSYGIAGLLMLAVSHRLYRAEDRMERLTLVACLLAVIPALNLATSDAAAVAGLVMTVLTVGLVSCTGKSLPRFWYGDFFPTFYACHLTVLGVLAV
ncbi:conjugal transfer pilus acetylase TraX [Escherichia coli]|uniref:conjugal transfer pilus acetylase TraX n=19 Tax=Enterobacteriaceae TaxID=543 RepID=UPI001BB317B4